MGEKEEVKTYEIGIESDARDVLAAVLKGRGIHWDGAMDATTRPSIRVQAEPHQVVDLENLFYVMSVDEVIPIDGPWVPARDVSFRLSDEDYEKLIQRERMDPNDPLYED
jgi:hypothetical protein